MKLTVIGVGFVGLVTGSCFAEMGNKVICMDVDSKKINMLKNGEVPIYEPGLSETLDNARRIHTISFTTDLKESVEKSDIIFLCLPTPSKEDGEADLSYIKNVVNELSSYMNGYKIIINKSTAPVGTIDMIREIISNNTEFDFDLASNPEFLAEGRAVRDFKNPNRIVVGTDKEEVANVLHELYKPFMIRRDRFITMDTRSSELTKYASNTFLATRISFMNELSLLCEKLGADINKIRIGMGMDERIGLRFLYAGIGYGGSCFPKDVKAFVKMGEKFDLTMSIARDVEKVNYNQKIHFFNKIKRYFDNSLGNKNIAVWGLSFKPHTNDLREAPSVEVINLLVKEGAKIIANDPAAIDEARKVIGEENNIRYCDDQYETIKNADALVVFTEWPNYRLPDFMYIKNNLKNPVIFDARNIYDREDLSEFGIEYFGIGS